MNIQQSRKHVWTDIQRARIRQGEIEQKLAVCMNGRACCGERCVHERRTRQETSRTHLLRRFLLLFRHTARADPHLCPGPTSNDAFRGLSPPAVRDSQRECTLSNEVVLSLLRSSRLSLSLSKSRDGALQTHPCTKTGGGENHLLIASLVKERGKT